MGLANSDIIKGAVDALTTLIEGINKAIGLIEKLTGNSGIVKSLVSLVTVIGALQIGKKVVGGLFG